MIKKNFNLAKIDGDNVKLTISLFVQDRKRDEKGYTWLDYHKTALVKAINGISIGKNGLETKMSDITPEGGIILERLFAFSGPLKNEKSFSWKFWRSK